MKSRSISQLKSPDTQDSEEDVPPLISRNQDFDDFEDDEDVHSYELQDSNSDSDEENDEICSIQPR